MSQSSSHSRAPELFERRGTDICIAIEYPLGHATWVNFAAYMAAHRFVRVGRHVLRWDEFEAVMGSA